MAQKMLPEAQPKLSVEIPAENSPEDDNRPDQKP